MGRNRRVLFFSLALVLILLSPAALSAKTVYVLIVADTDEDPNGAGRVVDVRNLSNAFKLCVPPRYLELRTLTGNTITKNRVLRAIRRIRADSDDGVVFLYSGHGAFDDRGHFFYLPDRSRLYREDVVEAVRRCGAGADTVLSSSCNVYSPRAEAVAFEPGQWNRIAPLFESLFLDSRGLTDINGASEGEYSFTNGDVGSTFFHPFYVFLMQNADRSMDWDDAIKDLRSRVKAEFRSHWPDGYRDEDGRLQRTQTLRVFHEPPGWPGDGGGGGGGGRHRFGVQIFNHRGPGVLVEGVFRGSPADQAEVDRGDVILSVNGVRVSSEQEMLRAVANSPRRMRFQLKGGRTGRIYNLEATLND